MSRVEENHVQAEIKKAEKRGKRKGFFARIRSFFIGILVGVLIITSAAAYTSGHSFINSFKTFFTRDASVENHGLTLDNWGFFGYKTADFADAILGHEENLAKLEVYSQEVSDVATITQAGFAKIKAFSKYQFITYHGTAIYTVDLQGLTIDNFSLDKETKTLTLTVPDVVLEPINIPSENIEFGEVEKSTFLAFGDIKLTPEQQANIETEAKKKMEVKLAEEQVVDSARLAAQHAIWELYQPIVSNIAPKYKLEIVFADSADVAEDADNANSQDDANTETNSDEQPKG